MLDRKKFLLLFFICVMLFFSGCSTTTKLKPGESVAKKNRAAEYAGFGSNYYDEAQYDQALDFFFLSLKQNILIDNDHGIIESYNSIGKTYLAAGKVDLAENYYKKAQEVAFMFNDPALIIRCKNNQGEIYLAKGDFSAALATFTEAYTAIENPSKADDAAIILHNIGVANKRLGNFKDAETNLLKALELNEKNSKFKEMASDNYLLASIYSKTDQYSEALNYIDKALKIDKLIENSFGIAKDLFAKGLIQRKAGSPEEAYYTFKRDALIFESLSLPSDLINCLKNLEELAVELSRNEDILLWQTTRQKLEQKIGTTATKQ